ncbi:hypothetical protein HYDPIDRAFT_112568 [Hydnomerulius pinastri MD-312]|uniref:Unplaced genomic scaffold scaffold_14, whole genome shotgun sequence n=1 Tax=Hydnomerulius pinastri MD-312 TaxID=994086 RepID=A0A0C9WFA1_9AGAM|nr:hypothetical protein HYDPIDRAFT_112568 [Hydnomerulius pinastri MD-312]
MAPLIMTLMQGPLCGTLATMLLYGIFCMQTFYYARNYTEDRKAIKWLVACLWVLESAHTALTVHFIEYYLILNFNNESALDYVVWSMGAAYFIGFLVAWAVDICFVWRIWQLSKQMWICIALATLATVRTGFGLGNCTFSFRYPAIKEFHAKVFPTMVVGWTLSAFADTLIAVALCYYLHKNRSGMRRMEHIINRLLLYSINTGALTSLFAILVIIMFLAFPATLVFVAFVQVQSKLYAISLLASLNSRKSTLEGARRAVATADDISLRFLANSGTKVGRQTSLQSTMPRIEITKNIEMDIRGDEESSHGTV